MSIENVWIYHITHIKNLSSIVSSGKLFSDSIMNEKYMNIGYSHIKERRKNKKIDSLSCFLADCVPFYFTVRSPMLYAVYKKNTEYTGGQEDIIYLCTQIKNILHAKLPYCLTDGHAVEKITEFSTDLNNIKNLDWNAIKTNQWSISYPGIDDDLKRRKQAEFLIKNEIDFSLFSHIVVYNNEKYEYIQSTFPNLTQELHIKKEWYY